MLEVSQLPLPLLMAHLLLGKRDGEVALHFCDFPVAEAKLMLIVEDPRLYLNVEVPCAFSQKSGEQHWGQNVFYRLMFARHREAQNALPPSQEGLHREGDSASRSPEVPHTPPPESLPHPSVGRACTPEVKAQGPSLVQTAHSFSNSF